MTDAFDFVAWAEAHGFKPSTRPCKGCGVEFTTTERFETANWVGLQAPLHECGERYRLKTVVPKNLRERDEQKQMARKLSAALLKQEGR